MAFEHPCPHCQQTMQIEDHLVGTQVSCPHCGKVLTAPPAPGAVGYAPADLRQKKTGLAITALVLGILGLPGCIPLGLVGVVLGIVVLVKASGNPQVDRGKGFAIAGIATGAASLVFTPLLIAILLPSLARARHVSTCTVTYPVAL